MIVVSILIVSSLGTVNSKAQGIETDDVFLDPVCITAIMYTNGSITMMIKAKVNNMGIKSLVALDFRIDSLDVIVISARSGEESVVTTMTTMERHTMVAIHLQQEIVTNESEWVYMELQSNDVQSNLELEANGEYLHGSLIYYFRPNIPISNFTFIAILPSHSSMSHESVVPLFPEADENFTSGQSMAFVWHVSTLLSGQEHVFIVRYQTPLVSVAAD